MCLLIHQPKGVTFSKTEIADFVSYNKDGFGFMYGDGKKLHVLKMVGSAVEVDKAYRSMAGGRNCFLHFRMATHGACIEENSHPFEVVPGIALAHNGILSSGNPKNAAKTDTEHLIEYFIRPIAQSQPDLLFDPIWGKMLGRLIGDDNRLAIAHADGRMAIINEDTGTHHKGAWISNTYAWSAPHRFPKYYSYGSKGQSQYNPHDVPAWVNAQQEEEQEEDMRQAFDDDEATLDTVSAILENAGEMAVAQWIQTNPEQAGRLIADWYKMSDAEGAELAREHMATALEYIVDIAQIAEQDAR